MNGEKFEILQLKLNEKIVKPKLIFISNEAPIDSKWSDYTALSFALDTGKKDLANIILNGQCRVKKDQNTPSETLLHKAVKLGDIEIIDKLIAKGASLIAVDQEGNTPLHLAFILKRQKIVRFLLAKDSKYKIYKNLKNKQGLTYLHIACTQICETTTIRGLINAGANIDNAINVKSPYWPGFKAIDFAIKFRNEDAVDTLIQANINKRPKDRLNESLFINYIFHQHNNRDKYDYYNELTNFHMACMKDNPDILQCYIEFGAPLNIPLNKQVTLCPLYLPLHLAVEGNCKKNVHLLLKHGAMIDLCNSLKMTPLHLAFYYQHHEIVDLLWNNVKKNLIINKRDSYQLSYLHMAVAMNNLDIVKQLCAKGADIDTQVLQNDKNFSNYTPLHFAARYQRLEMAQFLLDRRAKVNVDSKCTITPLHLAVETGNKAVIDLLLNNGAKVDDSARNEADQTVLHLLVIKNISETFEYAEKFVELGCDVNAKDYNGNTALHFACAKISEGSHFLKILLDLGADINVKNNQGFTPLMEARDWRCSEFFDVIGCHIKKLKAIGAKVCMSNEKSYEILLKQKQNDPELARIDEKIKEEIDRMKKINLSLFMPLSNFLLLEPNAASIYGVGDTFKRIAEDEKLMEKYPMYGYLIKLQFRRVSRYLREKNQRKLRLVSVEILEEVPSKRKCQES